ncbi:MAG: hypothetical protein E7294_06510 [Lachnospiraceae bacterium]|nr:hypothetical protein [Lachnospiraceae bacterium]
MQISVLPINSHYNKKRIVISGFLYVTGLSPAHTGNLKLINGKEYEMISKKAMEFTTAIIDYLLTALISHLGDKLYE